MKGLFKNKPFIIMCVAVLLLAVLALISSGGRYVTWLENAVGTVVTPIQSFAAKTSGSIISFFERITKTTDADKELEQLRVRLAELERAEAENDRLQNDIERYKELLNYIETNPNYGFVTAEVIGSGNGAWFDVFTINAGRNHGIEKDMPVINANGLVGRITDVGATWSKVTAIIDTNAEVSVIVERTRDIAMARGILTMEENEVLELYFLSSGYDLVPGDIVTTNGMGSVYPKGLVVGTVSEVTRNIDSASGRRNALISPAVDFMHLEEVMVIIETDTNIEATP